MSELFHVLLVEEDSSQVEIYSDMIREVAECRIDVRAQVDSQTDWLSRANYHVIVIDHPRGMELLEQARRLSPMTAVIVVAADATVESAVAAIRMGAEEYLKKPFKIDLFQMAVKRGLDRKAVYAGNQGASSMVNLLNCCQLISASLEQGKILEIVQSYLRRELASPYSAIYRVVGGEPSRIEVGESVIGGQVDRATHEILDIAIRAQGPIETLIPEQGYYRIMERGHLSPGFFVMKFRCVDEEDLYCVVLSPIAPPNLGQFENHLRLLRAQIEVTGHNLSQFLGMQQLAYLDDATGLYNTRYLNFILDREIINAKSSSKPFAVLFIDADRFKSVNDNHGHLVGTKILNELGVLLKKLVRDSDTLFRYGGDEFVAVLSGCDLAMAKQVAERTRATVEGTEFLSDRGLNLRITVSIGVALFPDHAQTKQQIIDAADQAMYASKRKSRNAVTLAQVPSTFLTTSIDTPPPVDKPAQPTSSGQKDSKDGS